jgi:hypothetical protein
MGAAIKVFFIGFPSKSLEMSIIFPFSMASGIAGRASSLF